MADPGPCWFPTTWQLASWAPPVWFPGGAVSRQPSPRGEVITRDRLHQRLNTPEVDLA